MPPPSRKKASLTKRNRTAAVKSWAARREFLCPVIDRADSRDDLLREQQNETISTSLSSASFTKIGDVLKEPKITETPVKNVADQTGHFIINFKNLMDMMKHLHIPCTGKLCVETNSDKRRGLDCVIHITCDKCQLNYTTQSSCQSEPGTYKRKDSQDLNNRAVYAVTEMGCSQEELKTFCEIVDIPVSACSKTMWQNRVNQISSAVKDVTAKSLAENRQELFDIYPKDEDGNIHVRVTSDASWMTRGWSSKVGVAFVMSMDTGKPLDVAVRVNYCQQCHFCKFKKSSARYKRWYRIHKPNCKYDNVQSKAMEADMAEELWTKSKNYKIYYRFMVSDGDSSSWLKVRSIYGSCDDCVTYFAKTTEEQENFEKTEDGEKFWLKHRDSNECLSVIKENCINHVTKALTTSLRKVREKFPRIGGAGKNKLTDIVIKKRASYFRKAIKKNKLGPKASQKEIMETIEEVRREIKASHFHSCLVNPCLRHNYCKKEDGWCDSKMGKTLEDKSHHLDVSKVPGAFKGITDQYSRLTSTTLLKRCISAKTTNQQESLNNLVWSKLPKRKYHGRTRVEMAANSAILNWCFGNKCHEMVLRELGIECSKTSKRLAQYKDLKRVQKSLCPPIKAKTRKLTRPNDDYDPGKFN